jgi:heat shock protein HtpX
LEAIAGDDHVLEHANKVTAPMFIANPFAKAGRFAAGLTSTHPPIDERIRILRSIGGSVSFQQYDAAWRTVRGRERGVVPSSALAQETAQPVRPASEEGEQDKRQRMREAGDVLRKVNQFIFLPCACGLTLKLPPDFKKDKVACPRCHKELEVPVAQLATAAQLGELMAGQTQPPLRVAAPRVSQGPAAAGLQITRQGNQWQSFRCACGNVLHLAPNDIDPEVTCPSCGQKTTIVSR